MRSRKSKEIKLCAPTLITAFESNNDYLIDDFKQQ